MLMVRRLISTLLLSLILACLGIATAAAATSDTGVVRSYDANASVRQGMLVALSTSDPNGVVALTTQTVSQLFGVVVSPNDAPITVTGSSGTQAYVATSGQYDVLVSTENGLIHAGDYISISTLDGIGMKAADAEAVVVGRASADLTSADIIQNDVKVATDHGTETVAIGSLPVTIAIAANPSAGHGLGNLPGFLQITTTAIANKPVAASRVYAALGVLLISVGAAAVILYSGIRGGIVAIGRNPLARKAIFGATLQAMFVGLGVFILGLFAVYLLLRL